MSAHPKTSAPDLNAARRAALVAANINPNTGLATDYLNHFNEAIMLLEMIPEMPECAGDFLSWQPLSYAEHFIASNFRGRELAVAAYQDAPAEIRVPFDDVCRTMTTILLAIREGVELSRRDATRMRLADQALDWLKPLVAKAGGIINGADEAHAEQARPQSDADLIMSN